MINIYGCNKIKVNKQFWFARAFFYIVYQLSPVDIEEGKPVSSL